ncbi:MAG: OmpH family outer membrane protein [Alphaproteobacteria bacterium]|nr:OmpH family outer membrane protein [Alphaproteobacteria bacterium]
MFSNKSKFFIGVIVSIFLSLMNVNVYAQQTPVTPTQPTQQNVPSNTNNKSTNVSIAVVDFEKVIIGSKAASGLKNEIDQMTKNYQTELAKQEDTLRAAERSIQMERDKLTQDQFQKKKDGLMAQANQYQTSAQQKKKQLQQMSDNGVKTIRTTMIDILRDLAKQRGYTLVLDKQFVILSADGFDITNEVIRLVDQKLPSLKSTAAPATPAPAVKQ